jgi:nucleotide-binding universal stress UspA family protein
MHITQTQETKVRGEQALELHRTYRSKFETIALAGYEMKQLARAERDIGDALEALLDQAFADAKRRAQRVGVSDVKIHAGWGDPVEVTIETARRQQVDAIVMGRRGCGCLAGLLLVSVSQKVASLAPCPVILVP